MSQEAVTADSPRPCLMNVILGRLVVSFVLCLICFIAYSSQIFIIWPWYGRALSVELVTLLLPFNVLVAMLLWNYFLCVVTDPGQVPEHWTPDVRAGHYEVNKTTAQPRYCRMCQRYKPPRAHHCRQCNRCVLRMDHHCPWVNNCVGHFNYGHFIRFLFYVDVACSYHAAMVTRRVIFAFRQTYWHDPTGLEFIFIILNYVSCIPVLLLVGGFSLYHFYCLLGNSTTIEGWEKDRAATMVRRGKISEVKFPYNLGWRMNVESVLGDNPLLWLWPTPTPGTGLIYPVAGVTTDDELVWPPRDPTLVMPNGGLAMPSSPWTYGNGSVNPDLEPSNAHLRAESKSRRRKPLMPGASSLPPYHPDYQEAQEMFESKGSSPYDSEEVVRPLVRMGSEGYEVKQVNREYMLTRYLQELGEQPDRYRRYIPEPDSDTSDEETPLANAKTWSQKDV